MRTRRVVAGLAAVLLLVGWAQPQGSLDPAYLDKLLAPVALYPDQLLAQVLLCSENSNKVGELATWLKKNAQLKGSDLQQAAQDVGFEPSFVALAPFPQVVELMAGNLRWTSQIGGAFAVDRSAVFASIQRLRRQSQAVGSLKSTPQQKVETKTTSSGEQVIVIEPANPQVIYVPQYNPEVVYVQPTTTTTTVVVEQHHDDSAAVAGTLIGFTAGVVIGASMNNYYYGPYGYRGGAYMYNDAWDDWYDDRADAREDWYENREDARENYSEHRQDMAENRSERASDARENRGERSGNTQEQRTQRQENRNTPEAQAQREQRRTEAQGKAQQAKSSGATPQAASSASAQGRSAERSGTRSDAFSNYSSGRSTERASSRGERSRSSSRSSSGRSRRR
jgi:hypothetical protein